MEVEIKSNSTFNREGPGSCHQSLGLSMATMYPADLAMDVAVVARRRWGLPSCQVPYRWYMRRTSTELVIQPRILCRNNILSSSERRTAAPDCTGRDNVGSKYRRMHPDLSATMIVAAV